MAIQTYYAMLYIASEKLGILHEDGSIDLNLAEENIAEAFRAFGDDDKYLKAIAATADGLCECQ